MGVGFTSVVTDIDSTSRVRSIAVNVASRSVDIPTTTITTIVGITAGSNAYPRRAVTNGAAAPITTAASVARS